MKKTVAVFGHYDSRGGTVAMEIGDRTLTEARKGFRRYDREMFGITAPREPATKTVYGMRMRAADQAVHSLMYGNGSPAVEDFLFVAELADETELGLLTSSRELDNENADPPVVVLIDETTAPPEWFMRYPDDWDSMSKRDREKWMNQRDKEYSGWVKATLDITLQAPVKLEVVSPALIPIINRPADEVGNEWWGQFAITLDKQQAARRSWNDDAFGFWFVPVGVGYEIV